MENKDIQWVYIPKENIWMPSEKEARGNFTNLGCLHNNLIEKYLKENSANLKYATKEMKLFLKQAEREGESPQICVDNCDNKECPAYKLFQKKVLFK